MKFLRREELNQRHMEIRNKYGKIKKITLIINIFCLLGLGTNQAAQNPKENIYTVENEHINLSLR